MLEKIEELFGETGVFLFLSCVIICAMIVVALLITVAKDNPWVLLILPVTPIVMVAAVVIKERLK
jgi:hypothetical protein